jgi:hypothetical protein
MEKENKSKNTGRSYLSLIGGAIALLAFFAPWAGCNRGRDFWGSAGPPPNMRGPSELSGADLAADKPEFYIALVAALIIVIVFLIFMFRKQLGLSRWPIIISSIGGIVFLIAEYINLQNQEIAELVTLRWGSYVTLIGFVLALVGAPFLKSIHRQVLTIGVLVLLLSTSCTQNIGNSETEKNNISKKQNAISASTLNADRYFISNHKGSLFFIIKDTIVILSLNTETYSQRSKIKIKYRPHNWQVYLNALHTEINVYEYNQKGNLVLYENSAVIVDGNEVKEVKPVSYKYDKQIGTAMSPWNYWISEMIYPAPYYSYVDNTLKLKNGFKAITKEFKFKYREEFSNGIPIEVSTRDSVDFKFGEVVYKNRMVQVGRTKEIRLKDADFICFGSDGLIEYLKDFNKEIEYSQYPFIFYIVNNQNTKTSS